MLKCFDTSYRDKVKRLLNVMLPIIGTQMAIIGMNFFDASMSGQAGDIDLAGAAIIAKRINQAAQRRNQEKGNNADAYAHHIPQRHIINSRLQSHALQKMRQKGKAFLYETVKRRSD